MVCVPTWSGACIETPGQPRVGPQAAGSGDLADTGGLPGESLVWLGSPGVVEAPLHSVERKTRVVGKAKLASPTRALR
jgi:hypothetical protein